MKYKILQLLLPILVLSCGLSNSRSELPPEEKQEIKNIIPGSYRFDAYLNLVKNKNVGIIANHTAQVGNTHLVDTLLSLGIKVQAVFAPEHGFRGEADDGSVIEDGTDEKTGIEIRSLYGKNRKPSEEMMSDIDIMIFDIQDVGARFYTFISTMHYGMEAAAEKGISFIVLDRPNPNGNYVDGPVREEGLQSFVGMHPIPIVHGLTVGELAKMVNGEGWLENGLRCDLTVVEMLNYNHQSEYTPPVKPSPNLPTQESIILYPSLCLFEGTEISVGRGTYEAFSQIGHPSFEPYYEYSFTPVSIPGMSTYPKHQDKKCYGISFLKLNNEREFTLKYLIEFYNMYPDKGNFFRKGFDRLAGNTVLKEQIKNGLSEDEIRKSWEPELSEYKEKRKKYLIYSEKSGESN